MNRLLSQLQIYWRFNRLLPLLLLALLLANGGMYAYLGMSVSPRLASTERSFIDLQARARKAQQVNAAARSPQQAFRRGQADLEKFNQLIPDRSGLSELVGEIYAIARGAGLDIKAIRYQPKKSEGHRLLEYPLTFSVSGEYAQIKDFIYRIEQSPRLIAIDKLSLDRGGKDEGGVKLSISMTTYFRLEAA